MLTGNGAPDEDRTRRNSIDSRVPSPAGSGASCGFCNNGAAAGLELGCTRRARPSSAECLPFHHGRGIVFFRSPDFRQDIVSGGGPGRTFEPTVTLRRRIRDPAPLAAGGTGPRLEDPGGFEPLCARVKGRSISSQVLTLRIHRLDGCGGKPRRFHMARRDGVAPLLRASPARLARGRQVTPSGRRCIFAILLRLQPTKRCTDRRSRCTFRRYLHWW